MNKKDLLNLLDNIKLEELTESTFNWYDRVLIIDGLNLFLRNFAALNYINSKGIHIGGLGGFLKSLGYLINHIKPTSVFIVFDGVGSSINRKNINVDYKNNRGKQRMTNWIVFNNMNEENNSKVNQITRLIHYLKCLPVKILSIEKNEADDIIAYIALHLSKKYKSKNFIVSSDKDFIQLVNENIIIYRPTEKQFYDYNTVQSKFGILPENFILLKTLTGDQSDKIKGIKDLGPKTLIQKFPEIQHKILTLEDIFQIAEEKYQHHVIYSRILLEKDNLKNNFKIMDLKNPLLSEEDKIVIDSIIYESLSPLNIKDFTLFYNEDGLGNILSNVDFWLKNNFLILNNLNK